MRFCSGEISARLPLRGQGAERHDRNRFVRSGQAARDSPLSTRAPIQGGKHATYSAVAPVSGHHAVDHPGRSGAEPGPGRVRGVSVDHRGGGLGPGPLWGEREFCWLSRLADRRRSDRFRSRPRGQLVLQIYARDGRTVVAATAARPAIAARKATPGTHTGRTQGVDTRFR